MQQSKELVQDIQELLEAQVNNRLLLAKMEIASSLSKVISKLVISLVAGLLLVLCIFFLSIMGGEYFTELTGSRITGFGIIAGIFFLLFLASLFIFYNPIRKLISNSVLQAFFDDEEADHDEDKK